MNKLKFNPENAKYYSEEFIKGFECGVERQFNADMAEKTAEWIPVKDRMPDFNDIVLASVDSDYDELRVILTVYNAEEFWFNGTIKAWMPVPEPYKAE